jgi:AcrR family transcriptional regulator
VARPALTDEQVEVQREAVCEAATRLFARHGFDAVTMRAIAEETGRSHTAAYRYFRNKEEIFQRVRAAAFHRFADFLDDASRGEDDPARRVTKLMRAYADFALGHPDHYRLMFEMTEGPREPTAELSGALTRAFGHALVAAESAVEAKLLVGEPRTLAHLVWIPLHGVVSLHLAGQLIHGRTVDELVEPVIAFVLGRNMPGAPPAERPRRSAGRTRTQGSTPAARRSRSRQ